MGRGGAGQQAQVKRRNNDKVEEQDLRRLVADGLSTRQIAARLERSQTNVRRYLSIYGLATKTEPAKPLPPTRSNQTMKQSFSCKRHGSQVHLLYPSANKWICSQCANHYATSAKQQKKQILVDEAGGCCLRCQKQFHQSQFDFHHRDPAVKEFTLSSRGISQGIDKLREEAAKCDLLCANCHREAEEKLAGPPSERVLLHRRRQEQLLAGRGCQVCGYHQSRRALDFHHLNRSTKRFHLGHDNMDRSMEALRKEAAKCAVLCANCHRGVEAGIIDLN